MLSVHCEGFIKKLLLDHSDWYLVGTEKIYSKAGLVPTSLMLMIFYISNNRKDSQSVTTFALSSHALVVSGVGYQVLNYEEILDLTERYKKEYAY